MNNPYQLEFETKPKVPLNGQMPNFLHPQCNQFLIIERPLLTSFGLNIRRQIALFDQNDAIWLMRYIYSKGIQSLVFSNKRDTAINGHAIVWALFNRYAIDYFQNATGPNDTFAAFLQQTMRNEIPNQRIQMFRQRDWSTFFRMYGEVIERFLCGLIQNPNLGIASRFIHTSAVFRRLNGGRSPSFLEWQRFNLSFGQRFPSFSNFTWIGQLPNLDQYKFYSFFYDNRLAPINTNTNVIHF